jgi:hypothetical protein
VNVGVRIARRPSNANTQRKRATTPATHTHRAERFQSRSNFVTALRPAEFLGNPQRASL